MSIVRQLLQVAAVGAVRGRTIAGDNVFDSRIDTLTGLQDAVAAPVLIFSIEENEQAAGGQGEAGFLGRSSEFKMMVQAAVFSPKEIRDENGSTVVAELGDSDAAFEAHLNILDRQWRQVLHGNEEIWATIFRGLVTRIGKIIDTRAVDPETGRKHALRYTQVEIDVVDEPLPGDALPPGIADGLAAMEADGDASYAEVARVFRAMLAEGSDWPDWRILQSQLFLDRGEMAALGQGPLRIDDLVDFDQALISANGSDPIVVTSDD